MLILCVQAHHDILPLGRLRLQRDAADLGAAALLAGAHGLRRRARLARPRAPHERVSPVGHRRLVSQLVSLCVWVWIPNTARIARVLFFSTGFRMGTLSNHRALAFAESSRRVQIPLEPCAGFISSRATCRIWFWLGFAQAVAPPHFDARRLSVNLCARCQCSRDPRQRDLRRLRSSRWRGRTPAILATPEPIFFIISSPLLGGGEGTGVGLFWCSRAPSDVESSTHVAPPQARRAELATVRDGDAHVECARGNSAESSGAVPD